MNFMALDLTKEQGAVYNYSKDRRIVKAMKKLEELHEEDFTGKITFNLSQGTIMDDHEERITKY